MKIAVILASMDIEYVRETLQGIIEQERKEKNDLYIFNVYSGPEETLKYNVGEYNLYSLVNLEEFDGVILFANMIQGHNTYNEMIRAIRKAGVPTVCIDSLIEGFCHVGTDSYRGMRDVVEHFVKYHGMTDFFYVSGLDFNSDSRERLRAFRDVLQENNIPFDEKNIYKGNFTFTTGYEAGQWIIESGELPQAVICATDGIALGVRRALIEKGIKIPEQVALAGFDNSFEARNSVPVLTTAQHEQKIIGMETAGKINRFITRKEELISEDFPATLVIGESCGCKNCKKLAENSVREQYIEMKENFETQLHHSNMMTDDLNDSKDYDDFIKRLKLYIEKLECDRFYLCLCPEVVRDLKTEELQDNNLNTEYRVAGYPDKMSVELAYEYGEYVSCGKIHTAKMLPRTGVFEKENGVYCFSPIHYRDHCLGYLAVEGSQFVMESPMYRTWLINLATCLENLRKQAVLQKLLKHVDNMYVQDALTGLYNRFGFDRYTKGSFQHCIDTGKSFMIFFADLDGLKMINDKNGHEKGDLAICTVANALHEVCNGQEICARFGGDEYVVFAQDYIEQDALLFGKRLEQCLAAYNDKLKTDFVISASYGYQIVYPKKGDTLEEYIKQADAQMYIRKKARKKQM